MNVYLHCPRTRIHTHTHTLPHYPLDSSSQGIDMRSTFVGTNYRVSVCISSYLIPFSDSKQCRLLLSFSLVLKYSFVFPLFVGLVSVLLFFDVWFTVCHCCRYTAAQRKRYEMSVQVLNFTNSPVRLACSL